MRIAYFDLIGGASGDMILGAMIDAGLSFNDLSDGLADLRLDGYEIQQKKVQKNGFHATQVSVDVQDKVTERHLSEIIELIQASQLPDFIQTRAIGIFQRIGEVEANIHGVEVEKIHLHELGGIDTIVDVTGALLGLHILGIEKIFCSSFPVGRGFIRGAHGLIPLPSPATTALLKGVPIRTSEIEKELVTPTGAAILTDLASSYGPIPSMTLLEVGYGAGMRDMSVPNLIRLLIGKQDSISPIQVEDLVVLETNIDDLNPQIYDHLMDQLFSNGALDVTLTPIQMKKNRPAIQVSILCKQDLAQSMRSILFSETSTLGIRTHHVERYFLPRSMHTVETPYGEVRVKTAEYLPGKHRSAPEYDDCRRLALKHNVPFITVYKAAQSKLN